MDGNGVPGHWSGDPGPDGAAAHADGGGGDKNELLMGWQYEDAYAKIISIFVSVENCVCKYFLLILSNSASPIKFESYEG